MTTLRGTSARDLSTVLDPLRPWIASAVMLGALSAIVAARWLATTRGVDAFSVGAGFGVALAALWLVSRRGAMPARAVISARAAIATPAAGRLRRLVPAVVAGSAFGLALVALAIAGAAIGGAPIVPGLSRPAAPFLPWAAITLVVATAEEGLLRGVLFDRLRAAGGLVPAVAITTVVFALMHVPLYGWHVVPLDLAVGLGLAGLRLSTRTILAPAVAHLVADLATWWL